jgi:aryl-alcohol dehydrogenase-like predicted oxidoreductase
MDVTAVGFGAWAIGGTGWRYGWGDQDDDNSIAAIRHAVEVGVNWIDTAAVYGHGHSEEVVGRALRDIPAGDRPFVFTKCAQRREDDPSGRSVHSRESIRAECEASLGRLGIERIDLYQLHQPPDDDTPYEESWAAMLELVDEGKVRAVGVSNYDVDALSRCEALGHVGTLQPPFSLIERSAGAEVIPWAGEHETGVIVYSPMQAGLLSGAFTRERAESFPENDWRTADENFREPRLSQNLLLQEALRPIAVRHDTTAASVAIAWTLSWPGVTAAIVGARSWSQVDGWIGASTLELDERDLSDLKSALQITGAGRGPLSPQ